MRTSGGRPQYGEEKYPDMENGIRTLIAGSTDGNPERVLSYTTESLRTMEGELTARHIPVSHETINKLLTSRGYRKQTNKKMLQVGEVHPDRNARFDPIHSTAAHYIEAGDPVISGATNKKEPKGNCKNTGKD